jgi:uncharacterized protein YuzE
MKEGALMGVRRRGASMRIHYDAEVDALSIIFRESTVTTSDLAEGITAEYDQMGNLVGLEILDANRRFGDLSVLDSVTLEGVGLVHTGAAKERS